MAQRYQTIVKNKKEKNRKICSFRELSKFNDFLTS